MSATANVKVVCRFRPPNALELREAGGESIVQIDEDGTNVKLRSQEAMKGPEAQGFTFDRVFQMDTKQHEVFEFGVKDIVDGTFSSFEHFDTPSVQTTECFACSDVMDGYNGTVFAYGMTGSGKSVSPGLRMMERQPNLCSPAHFPRLQHTMMVSPFRSVYSHRRLTVLHRCRAPTSMTPR